MAAVALLRFADVARGAGAGEVPAAAAAGRFAALALRVRGVAPLVLLGAAAPPTREGERGALEERARAVVDGAAAAEEAAARGAVRSGRVLWRAVAVTVAASPRRVLLADRTIGAALLLAAAAAGRLAVEAVRVIGAAVVEAVALARVAEVALLADVLRGAAAAPLLFAGDGAAVRVALVDRPLVGEAEAEPEAARFFFFLGVLAFVVAPLSSKSEREASVPAALRGAGLADVAGAREPVRMVTGVRTVAITTLLFPPAADLSFRTVLRGTGEAPETAALVFGPARTAEADDGVRASGVWLLVRAGVLAGVLSIRGLVVALPARDGVAPAALVEVAVRRIVTAPPLVLLVVAPVRVEEAARCIGCAAAAVVLLPLRFVAVEDEEVFAAAVVLLGVRAAEALRWKPVEEEEAAVVLAREVLVARAAVVVPLAARAVRPDGAA